MLLTWSSLTSTQRMENGGSRWAKPSNGGLEQLVTNCTHQTSIGAWNNLSQTAHTKKTSIGAWNNLSQTENINRGLEQLFTNCTHQTSIGAWNNLSQTAHIKPTSIGAWNNLSQTAHIKHQQGLGTTCLKLRTSNINRGLVQSFTNCTHHTSIGALNNLSQTAHIKHQHGLGTIFHKLHNPNKHQQGLGTTCHKLHTSNKTPNINMGLERFVKMKQTSTGAWNNLS